MIPMALYVDNKPYFDELIHVNGYNLSIEWSLQKIHMIDMKYVLLVFFNKEELRGTQCNKL